MSVNLGFGKYIKAFRLKYFNRGRVLLEENIKVKDPIVLFRSWLEEAQKVDEILEPNAVCLATVSKDGSPSNRFMILRDVTLSGFVFFTNYGSRKAEDIAHNPNVSMAFYWPPLQRSVRIEGLAEKVPHEKSHSYFYQRPRVTQIATLASDQRTKIASRSFLEHFAAGIKATLGPKAEVPMPNWGGYLLRPSTVEFWQGQEDLMPDRIRFRHGNEATKDIDGNLVHLGVNGWVYERLAP